MKLLSWVIRKETLKCVRLKLPKKVYSSKLGLALMKGSVVGQAGPGAKCFDP